MEDGLLLIISLLLAVSLLSMLAEKLNIAYPIFLVISGLVIGFIPHVLEIILEPELVFLIFLPPLLYSAAWNMAWKDFAKNWRPISLLALGLVMFTSIGVALVSVCLIPGFTLALGFLLGGIISPPDPIAASSVMQKIKMNRRVLVILEGEGLVNDAVSLIVFRFALAAVLTGQFVLWKAGIDFMLAATGGIAIGLAIGGVIYVLHRYLPTTSSIDTGITVISPYLMYIAAEHFGLSGVLAVVSGGLFLSSRSTAVFSYSTRLQSQGFWDTLVFLMNGSVFILIGLQLPSILASLEPGTLTRNIYYGLIISLLSIFLRIIWVFPAAYLPRMWSKKVRDSEPDPGWKSIFIIAWSGMRGVVSLAAALSIPVLLKNGQDFPHRNQILFITFIVIFCTLILQGLSLPWLIRKLGIEVKSNAGVQEREIQTYLATAVLRALSEKIRESGDTNPAMRILKERYVNQLTNLEKQKTKKHPSKENAYYQETIMELVEVRRMALEELRIQNHYPDEMIRSFEKETDYEEARISERMP